MRFWKFNSSKSLSESELRTRLANATFHRGVGGPLTLDPATVRVHSTQSGVKFRQAAPTGPVTYGQLLLLATKAAYAVSIMAMAATITWVMMTWSIPAYVAGIMSVLAYVYASASVDRLERDFGIPTESFDLPSSVRKAIQQAVEAQPAEALLALRRLASPAPNMVGLDQGPAIDVLVALHLGNPVAEGTGIPRSVLEVVNPKLADLSPASSPATFGFQPGGSDRLVNPNRGYHP